MMGGESQCVRQPLTSLGKVALLLLLLLRAGVVDILLSRACLLSLSSLLFLPLFRNRLWAAQALEPPIVFWLVFEVPAFCVRMETTILCRDRECSAILATIAVLTQSHATFGEATTRVDAATSAITQLAMTVSNTVSAELTNGDGFHQPFFKTFL